MKAPSRRNDCTARFSRACSWQSHFLCNFMVVFLNEDIGCSEARGQSLPAPVSGLFRSMFPFTWWKVIHHLHPWILPLPLPPPPRRAHREQGSPPRPRPPARDGVCHLSASVSHILSAGCGAQRGIWLQNWFFSFLVCSSRSARFPEGRPLTANQEAAETTWGNFASCSRRGGQRFPRKRRKRGLLLGDVLSSAGVRWTDQTHVYKRILGFFCTHSFTKYIF